MGKNSAIQRNRELSAILEVSRVLTASFDLKDNLTSAMRILSSMLDMQRGCVFLLEPQSGELKLVAAYGLTVEEIKRGKYRIGEGIVGSVIKSGQPAVIPNIGSEPRFLNKTGSRPKKEGISFLSIPIGLKGEASGVISVDRIYSDEHGDVDDDLRVLSIVASLIAQFVKLWENFKMSEDEKEALRTQLKDRYSLPNLIGESEKFQAVLKTVMKVASTDATVLLLGESGTGKELIARTLHFQSRRAKGHFVAVNCAALPESLLEAELFGVEKGAFTGATSRRIGRFELAGCGSIFLDEIAELTLSLQAKLLRVLEEHTFERVGSSHTISANVRVITATNKNLSEEVRKGNFREDLYYRINILPILLPALRERIEDIPLLVSYYLKKFNVTYRKNIALSSDALDALSSYKWPGNVRELANTIERLVIMAGANVISKDDLPYNILHTKNGIGAGKALYDSHPTLETEIEAIEQVRIINALKENNMIQHKAASMLGITQRQLGYRIKKYKIALRDIK
ncbi:MAG: sigma 54-interacting transcriptional regulator [Nitrospirae bacterium]|nr:sigma 54-interacting transcriptional regulator [Nitrospirota bacterium]